MGRMTEIVCFESGEHFKSQKEAAERLGISNLAINASLRRNMAANGFHFYYADDPRLLDADFRPKTRNKRVRCIETGTDGNSSWNHFMRCIRYGRWLPLGVYR